MDEDLPRAFAEKERALIITPAGCGKTELIARAVSYSNSTKGKQLILTHTHAGVKSILDRLRRLGVSSKQYHVDTIDGFALQYAASFPISSGLGLDFDPASHEWNKVHKSAIQIISSSAGKKIISISFCGLYVDEYQDCTLQQHALIMHLAGMLPCRIVGDPLQGIFDFGNNQIVNWYKDIFPNFKRLGDKNTKWIPYRWKSKNENLGDWLLEIRENLKKGEAFDLHNAPVGVNWYQNTSQNEVGICKTKLSNEGDSIVAIHHLPHQAHLLAMNLKGTYTSMEEVESKDLMKWSTKLEAAKGLERAITAIEFAGKCMTIVSTELAGIKKKLEKGEITSKRDFKHRNVFEDLVKVVSSDNLETLLVVFEHIEKIDGRVLYRRELWNDMKRAIKEKNKTKEDISLQKIAWKMRDSERVWGRTVDRRTVSRTLLIKGLEFDHAIVLNADDLNAKELYVAMTRGSKSLAILSSSHIIQKEAPLDLQPPKESK